LTQKKMSDRLYKTNGFCQDLEVILNKYANSKRHDLIVFKFLYRSQNNNKQKYKYVIQIRYIFYPDVIECNEFGEDWSHHLINDITDLVEEIYIDLKKRKLIQKNNICDTITTRIVIETGDIEINDKCKITTLSVIK